MDIFAVTAGPGSFTGLRVGLTAVKAWSEVYGKPIAAISGLGAVAAQSSADSGVIAAFTDARRGQVFGGIFERNIEGIGGPIRIISEELVISPPEFIEIVAKLAGGLNQGVRVRFASPTPEILREALADSPFREATLEKTSENLAPWVGRLALGCAQRGELVNALKLDANYVRRMDAEMYWKDS